VSRLPTFAVGRLLLAGAVLAPGVARAAVPPAPARWVTDEAGFLSDGVRSSLDSRLEEYQGRTGHHLLVWIGRTTDGIPVEDFTVRAFEAWRVGRKGVDDGLVLFVFPEDRKVRIEVGYGLEAQVPDAIASRIIRDEIAPRIRAGDRDGAILAGVAGLVGAVDGSPSGLAPPPGPGGRSPAEARPQGGPRRLSASEKIVVGLVVIGFLILLVTNPSLAIYLLFSILSGGRGGGGSGGGGGYSGGGGRSGGGGATGSW
jgi:uncharacterized protein